MEKPGPPRPKASPKQASNGASGSQAKSLAKSSQPEAEAEAAQEGARSIADERTEVTPLEIPDANVDDLLATTGDDAERDPNKAYVAPRVIPAAPVPEAEEGRRVVLNLPDKAAVLPPSAADVDRARRRAPTVKVARGTLAARAEDEKQSASVPTGTPPVATRRLAPDQPGERGPPLSLPAPETPPDPPFASVAAQATQREPPATALHVSEPAPRPRSRLPLVAVLTMSIAGGAAALFALKTSSPDSVPPANAPAFTGASARAAAEPEPTAPPPARTVAQTPAGPASTGAAASPEPTGEPAPPPPTTTTPPTPPGPQPKLQAAGAPPQPAPTPRPTYTPPASPPKAPAGTTGRPAGKIEIPTSI
jgi:hypothetical protein